MGELMNLLTPLIDHSFLGSICLSKKISVHICLSAGQAVIKCENVSSPALQTLHNLEIFSFIFLVVTCY